MIVFFKNIGFQIFLAFWKFVAMLPMRVLHGISDFVFLILYYVLRYRRKVVYENLRNAFPDKTNQELTEISRKFYHHFCDLFIETIKMLQISEKEVRKRFVVKNYELLIEEYQRGKHILCIMSHFNNWEPFSCVGLYIPYYFVSIYKPLSNDYFDKLMIQIRSRFNHHVIPMHQTARVLTQNIKDGKLTLMNFLSDQSPQKHEIQYWANFLNQKTAVYLGAEKLAIKTKQPVYYLHISKTQRGCYEGSYIKLCDDASLLNPYELTDIHIRLLEEKIREYPQYWFWTHRRWKHKPENI